MMSVLQQQSHSDFMVTTEKLEELKGNIPRAGPKYRLGMYFETIHGVSDFEDVYSPSEDGYTSYWETDTEIDTELNNFIFSNVTGDSASVLCLDEAVDVLELRERQMQEQALRQQRLAQDAGHELERSQESKRSSASRQSRRSHNSGSDGMYDEPPPLPPRRISTSTETTGTSAEDHTYETLDDFQEDYKAQVEKKRSASKEDADSDSSGKARTRSPLISFTKARSNSIPLANDAVHRHQRKGSDPSGTEYSQKRKRSDKVLPKGQYPLPVKGFPNGIPEEYTDYISNKRLQPTSPDTQVKSPERRYSENRKSSKPQRSPSLIIKHKGQTFMIPVVDKKLQQRLEKVKGPPKTTPIYETVTKPNGHSSLTRTCSDLHGKESHRNSMLLHSVRSSPPKEDASKTKSKRHSQTNASKQVTHYGVL